MKNNLFLFVLVYYFIATTSFAQENTISCKQAPLLLSMLNKYHLQPIDLNAATSEQIFNDFFDKIDPYNNIFTLADINTLNTYKKELLSTTNDEKVCAFLKSTTNLYVKKVIKTDSIIEQFLQKRLDFTAKDSVTFTYSKEPNFSATEQDRQKRLIKRLKYQALELLFTPTADENPLEIDTKQLLLKEVDVRKQLGLKEKKQKQKLEEEEREIETRIITLFYNTIAKRYDPHTQYFSPEVKAKFQASLSKETKAFGLTFIESDNEAVEIDYLSPGGPAWKSNQLHQGDIAIQLKLPNRKSIDLTPLSVREVDRLVNNAEYDKIELTVRNVSGIELTVPLSKELIEVEENIIAGYLLNGEKKIGYLSLPGFYTEFNTENPLALGCANDVAKEILKLQKENIEGLILDLRFNGGGSVYEAIALMGIFIDEGPLFMQKEKNQKVTLKKDVNRGTIYNGPLIIMVNGLSASASELVTAGLRDYNRALIVGSTTYGKAIAQVTLPLDTSIDLYKRMELKKSNAYVNVTVEKLYRINGISHQKTGIVPDIELPDFYSNLEHGEASEPYALESEKVEKKVLFKPNGEFPVQDLKERSSKRVQQGDAFKRIKSVSDSLKNAIKQKEIMQLNLDAYRKREKRINALEEEIDQIMFRATPKYTVLPASYDSAILQADKFRNETNIETLKKIKDDIYIEETFFIMTDLINSKKN